MRIIDGCDLWASWWGMRWGGGTIPARFSYWSVSLLALLESGVDCDLCLVVTSECQAHRIAGRLFVAEIWPMENLHVTFDQNCHLLSLGLNSYSSQNPITFVSIL